MAPAAKDWGNIIGQSILLQKGMVQSLTVELDHLKLRAGYSHALWNWTI